MSPLDLFYRMAAGTMRYGVNDCARTAAALLKEAGRQEPFMAYRGRYRTALGWQRVIRRDGHRDLEGLVAAEAQRIGFLEIEPAEAEEYDFGLVSFEADGKVLAAPGVRYRGFWLVRAPGGARHEPAAKRAWRTWPH